MSSGLATAKITLRILGIKGFDPITSKSANWVNWITHIGPRTCLYCKEQNGKVYERNNPPKNIPVHVFLQLRSGTNEVNANRNRNYRWTKRSR